MKTAIALLTLSLSANSAWCESLAESQPFRFTGLREISQMTGAPAVPEPVAAQFNPLLLMVKLSTASYEVVLEESSAKLTASKVLTAHGHFEKFSGVASLDKDDLSRTVIQVTVDAASAVSDSWFLSTKSLRAKLKTDQFPSATLKSLSVKPTAAADKFEIESELVLMGETRRQVITTTLSAIGNGKFQASGSFEVTVDGTSGTMEFSMVLRPKI